MDRDTIFTGDFSQVFLGMDTQKNQKVAIKIISPSEYRPYPDLKSWAKYARKEHISLVN